MLSDESGNYTDAATQASTTTAELTDRNSTYAESQDKVNQSVDVASDAFDNAGASAERYGDTIEEVQNQGGFFEGIKQGFKDFAESVGSNSELIADFFANTLSQMSQSFSDLFFNIITGRFDDLKDLAKQAFEAILRAFLDLVSAIVTKQIVISIGGLFGIGKGAQAAGEGSNPTDIAQQGAGVVGSGLGLFGSGGAFETVGDEEIEYRLAA
jgi:lambda family phage tail tape measure protein